MIRKFRVSDVYSVKYKISFSLIQYLDVWVSKIKKSVCKIKIVILWFWEWVVLSV